MRNFEFLIFAYSDDLGRVIEGYGYFFFFLFLIFAIPFILLLIFGVWSLNFIALIHCFFPRSNLKLLSRIILCPLVLSAVGSNIFHIIFTYNTLNPNMKNIMRDPIFIKPTINEGIFRIALLIAVYVVFPMLIVNILHRDIFKKKFRKKEV